MKLGKAFSDSLIIEQKTKNRLRDEPRKWWLGSGRTLLFATSLFGLFALLVIRLFHLTMIEGHRYRTLADENRTRELIRHAPRGIIFDRTGTPLVRNIAQYRLMLPCEGGKSAACVRNVSEEEGAKLREQGLPPGHLLEVDYQRDYGAFDESVSHVLGYTGELSAEELQDEYYQLRGYNRGDRVGRTGIEAVFEDRLRGRDGKELVEVDADGRILRTLGIDREIPGTDVTISLDKELSQVVAQAFPAGYSGAVLVTKPTTGEVLALYSSPSYSINAFSRGIATDQYQALETDPDQPLFNRAIGGVYPPGSTFKIVTSLAALEEGAVSSQTLVDDVGVLTIGPFTFPNWYFIQYGRKEGMVDIVRGIQRSNDIFFYKTGEWLGITKLADWARRVGAGKPLGIEIAGEASGLVPDPSWKESYFTSSADRDARQNLWYLGDTYHIAIGQGYLLTTPLQVNAWTNVIGNGGSLCRPTIEKPSVVSHQSSACKDLEIKKESIDIIMRGMVAACETGGTGWPLFNFSVESGKWKVESGQIETPASNSALSTVHSPLFIPIACKTGTAEFGDPKNRTHAWFTAFAPVPDRYIDSGLPAGKAGNQAVKVDQNRLTGDPELSVTVLVETGGEGSYVAAPVAKKIFVYWFTR